MRPTLGYVTSANYGHSIGRGIAYGYLPTEYADVGTKVDVVYFGERLGGDGCKRAFVRPGRQQDEGVNSKRNANRLLA